MQAGLVYIAAATGKMVVTSAISPVVQSTVTLITSMRTSTGGTATLQEVIQKRDITCTLQTIEATMIALKCDKEPLKTAAEHVFQQIQQIHQLLTKIADITAAHQAGYISRWRQLCLDAEIDQLENYMEVLAKRFKLLCDINTVVN
jgi:capsular polysaccharide biosynthesis protein